MLPTLLRAACDAVEDAIIVADSRGELLFANLSGTRLVGDDLRASGLWPDADAELGSGGTFVARALRGEEVQDFRTQLRTPESSVGSHYRINARALRNAAGDVHAVLLVARDVTRDLSTEQELVKAHAFLHSIVENIPNMIFVKDAQSLRFELFNRAGEDLLGLSRQDLLGKNDFDLFPRDQAEFFQARDRQTLHSGRLLEIFEEPIETSSGERWLHTKKIPIRDASGEPRYLLGISEDITERRSADALLSQAKAELEQRVIERTAELTRANEELRREIGDRERVERELRRAEQQLMHAQKMEAVGRLAGGVAHDFNNMLSAILGHVGLALSDVSPHDPLREDLQQIKEAAERATALTQQLLAYSRRQTMQPKVVDLNALVQDMKRLLERVIGEDVELVVEPSPSELLVQLDPSKLEQALVNLAVNACDAMPCGGQLRIALSSQEFSSKSPEAHGVLLGRYVVLTVQDTGTGMDAETQSKVFEPFFSTKKGERKIGLGLAMVYGIVVQSGGHIALTSEPGRGTAFELYFPEYQGERPSFQSRASSSTPSRSETILLVEDEAVVRRAAAAILRRAGYTILEASNGADALAIADCHPSSIDLLLTDVVMPGMSGPELARRLADVRPKVAVLYMSGYTANVIGREGRLDADVAFLEKPFTPNHLLEKVRAVLAGGSLASEQPE